MTIHFVAVITQASVGILVFILTQFVTYKDDDPLPFILELIVPLI